MSLLEELQAAIAVVADRVGPATVSIGRDRRGSGVVVAPGRVLTNAHNLRDSTTQVSFGDGRAEQGTVLGVDASGDLVVLEVETGDAAILEWAGAGAPIGAPVFATTLGRHGRRVTFGLVSATGRTFRGPRGRRITNSLEHTVPLARGSSGGPLTDAEGRLVGINTHRAGEGFYLALAADEALRQRVDALAAGTSPVRRTLGVAIAPAFVSARLRRAVGLPERDGLLVRGVEDGSPAARAGLHRGDLLVAAGGRDLQRADDLFAVLDALDEGAELSIKVVRGVEELSVTVSFTPPAPQDAQPSS
jgi:serine protease Do